MITSTTNASVLEEIYRTDLAAFILLFLCNFEECEIVSCQCKPNVNIDFYLLSFFYSNGKFQESCERVKLPDDCTMGFISGKKQCYNFWMKAEFFQLEF